MNYAMPDYHDHSDMMPELELVSPLSCFLLRKRRGEEAMSLYSSKWIFLSGSSLV